MIDKYSFTIQWSVEDDDFIARCPEFPGLSAFGSTRAEALAEGEIALQGFIESMNEMSEALPEPIILAAPE